MNAVLVNDGCYKSTLENLKFIKESIYNTCLLYKRVFKRTMKSFLGQFRLWPFNLLCRTNNLDNSVKGMV